MRGANNNTDIIINKQKAIMQLSPLRLGEHFGGQESPRLEDGGGDIV